MLEIQNLKKTYQHFTLDCSLSVKEGMITGLVGRNGAGKTTTFKAILGLVTKDSGTIQLFGKDISTLQQEDRERIGTVLPCALFSDDLTIHAIMKVLASLYRNFDKPYFDQLVQQFKLPMNKPVRTFSTGMKTTLSLVIALTHKADFLILDEPTAGLDVVVRNALLDLLRSFMEENPTHSILISSHNAQDLETLCDDFYMIDQGKILLHEETDNLLNAYAVLKVTEEQYAHLEKDLLLTSVREPYGYQCLVKERQFFKENYLDIIIERCSIDDIVAMLSKGE